MKNLKRILVLGLVVGLSQGTLAQAADLEANKKLVRDFYELALNKHKPTEAVKKYIGDKYIQHNPHVPDGTLAFTTYFELFFLQNPKASVAIKRVVAEGDLVVLHSHFKKNDKDRGSAVVDIFRVEAGKVVEHWDVIQSVPKKNANPNTMF